MKTEVDRLNQNRPRPHFPACLAALLLCLAGTAASGAEPAPDQVFVNAKIYTANPEHPHAEAIAIRGGRILACGTRPEVAKSAAPGATVIDLHGATVLPGLIDSHTHPISSGVTLTGADIGEAVEDVDALLAFAVDAKQRGRGLRGDVLEVTGVPLQFWSKLPEIQAKFNSGTLANSPLVLRGMDYHTAWANAALLRKAGVDKSLIRGLTDAQRKYYGHTPDFEPTGFAVDAGLEKINAAVPPPTLEQTIEGGRAAVRFLNGLGLTAWLEPFDGANVLPAYRVLSERGELTARVAALPSIDPRAEPAAELARVAALRKEYSGVTNLTLPGLKVFADGVSEIPSQSAAMLKPYRNSGQAGDLLFEPSRFADLCVAADRAGLIVHVHTIGDRAVRESLNGIAAARRANGPSGLPHTLTHVQWIDPADFSRFSELGVIASYQLYWAAANADAVDLVKPYVDPELYPWQYGARSLLNAGAIIAGASDWAVSTPNVFAAIHQAETRRGPLGVLNPEQVMPREAMLQAYTRNAARALGLQSQIGSLEAGKRADLILVDRDVLTVPAEALKETKVVWTMFDGQIVSGQLK